MRLTRKTARIRDICATDITVRQQASRAFETLPEHVSMRRHIGRCMQHAKEVTGTISTLSREISKLQISIEMAFYELFDAHQLAIG